VTTNVTTKPVTFMPETNHGCTTQGCGVGGKISDFPKFATPTPDSEFPKFPTPNSDLPKISDSYSLTQRE